MSLPLSNLGADEIARHFKQAIAAMPTMVISQKLFLEIISSKVIPQITLSDPTDHPECSHRSP